MVPTQTDVAIVGAGPTGLMLAGELAAAGVRCVVLERREGESNLTRAFGVHARTLEQFDARDLADDVVATGARVRRMRLFGDVTLDLSRLPSRFPYVLITPQYEVEHVLRKRAAEHGAVLVHGAEVVGLTQDADGVDLRVRAGRGETVCRAAYAVGADGVSGVVRDSLGLPFPGRSVIRSIMLADVRLRDGGEEVIRVNAVRGCFAFVAPFGDGWFRVFAWDRSNERPATDPVEFAEIREVTRRALGTDLGMHDPRWLSRFQSDERQVPRYQVGRVFLAGDAAHVHSPAGGQGMNTGIQDAANLGWKLAAAVQGWAPQGLLESYHTERRPVGRMVIRNSGTILRLVMLQPWAARTARNTVGAAALRIAPVARGVADAVSGVGIAYPAARGAHRLTGRRAPDVLLAGDGRPAARLYELLRGGGFALLAPAEVVRGCLPPLTRVRAAAPAVPGHPAVLVRPDGYVAWAGDERAVEPLCRQVRAALARWCGI